MLHGSFLRRRARIPSTCSGVGIFPRCMRSDAVLCSPATGMDFDDVDGLLALLSFPHDAPKAAGNVRQQDLHAGRRHQLH